MELQLLKQSLRLRKHHLSVPHNSTLRLFNGFTEGWPGLSIELYGTTVVLLNQLNIPEEVALNIPIIVDYLTQNLTWITAILLKNRRSHEPESRRGHLLFGENTDIQINENEVIYSLDLTLNQDTSFYIDARNLRKWLTENMAGKRVLNTFAHTGSLGVACLAGSAARVIQTDRSSRFLEIAKASTDLNNFMVAKRDFIVGDFFKVTANLRRQKNLFDCVILDPPFFSTSSHGRIDLLTQFHRLINKVRPLIAHEGYLVCINNALFLSGQEYLDSLTTLCEESYLSIDKHIPIPEDCTGYGEIKDQPYPTDPKPFNHPTKIAILRVRRKDGKQ